MGRRDMFQMEHGHDPLLSHDIHTLKSIEAAFGMPPEHREQYVAEQTGLDVQTAMTHLDHLSQHPEACKHAPRAVAWCNGERAKYQR